MHFTAENWQAVLLTLRLAGLTTLLLLVLCTPLAWWLAHTRSPLRSPISAVVALPLVLPPTVIGFYLLILLGPQGFVGQTMQSMGMKLLPFSFNGLLIGSLIYSLPFAVQPLQRAFEALGRRPMEVAATLGAAPLDRFFSVAFPMARTGFLTAAVMTFAHTVGEFGVVLMLGGNIPGQTRVVSVQIYDHVEALEYAQAHWLAAGMLVFSFIVLLSIHLLQRPQPRS
ncbi:molybdate ABC transporter permease subunit [Diaphorobacter aerolatus]|uniref:Molybdenum transport system permease n=1 Tax=Diaphorobacter aerolatus TaxID=1288495 RepID=A0A7H0GMX4_9BURK|nr:molybdate ABC transporter permease subunit [Diaphorobacter aerolatus]QNP49640.1 molybdate ABC transporter permease subunit [Diaphorobacter aerolatus]